MKLVHRSAAPSFRNGLRHRVAALLAAAGIIAAVALFQGSSAAVADGVVHAGTPGGGITIIIHIPRPHPDCSLCVD